MKLAATIAILAALTTPATAGDDPKPAPKASSEVRDRIDRLVKDLNADDFQKRQSAQAALIEMGKPALEPLRKMLGSSPTLEVRKRLERAVRGIERALLQPKTISLPGVSWPAAAVTPDGRFVAAPLDIWCASSVVDISSGKRTKLATHDFPSAVNHNGTQMLTRKGALVDVKTGRQTSSINADYVITAEYSHDGKYLVTGSRDKVVRVWDAANGKQLAALFGHEDFIRDVGFGNAGRWVISGSKDGTARIWDWSSGNCLAILPVHKTYVSSVALSRDGKYAVGTPGNKAARIWDTDSGRQIAVLRDPIGIGRVEISPDSQRLLTYHSTSGINKVVRVWDLKRGEQLFELKHAGRVNAAGFNADGSRLLTCGKIARIWDAKTGKLLVTLENANSLELASFDRGGTKVIGATKNNGATNNYASVWDAASGKRLRTFDFKDRDLRWLAVTPDGSGFVVAGLQFPAAIWDVATGEKVCDLDGGHAWQIMDLEFSPDGSRLVTASIDKTARLWDAATGKLVNVMDHKDRVKTATFSASGRFVVTASGPSDCTAKVWDGRTGAPVQVLNGHTDQVQIARFSRDESQVLTGADDNSARLWDLATGKELLRFQHGSTLTAAEFSTDGESVLTASSGMVTWYSDSIGKRGFHGRGASKEHTARVWDLRTGKQRFVLAHEGRVDASYTPDGKHVITACKGVVRRWDASTGKPAETIRRNAPKSSQVAFSPNRRFFVVVDSGQPAELWSTSTGKRLSPLEVENPFLVFFSPASRTFHAIVTQQGTFRSWLLTEIE